MINMIVGQPGGGKSYEAVAFHVLPALNQGRKVVTNLPLNVEAFRLLDARFPDLIVLKHDLIEKLIEHRKWNLFARAWDKFSVKEIHRPFSSIDDYGDLWRHPVNGFGVLYVIDECHLCLPRGKTIQAVEEWFSLHRHELADVLLITQSYGKVCKPICDMVQVLYRVKKATAFGTNESYIRKVQDGIGGEVVNTGIRKYKKNFFTLYKSHTKSSEAGQELSAVDIVPFWKRWPVWGTGLCALVLVGMLFSGKFNFNPLNSANAKSMSAGSLMAVSSVPSVPSVASAVVTSSNLPDGFEKYAPKKPLLQLTGSEASHPFSGLTIHITAFVQSEKKWLYSFTADQNGQPSFTLTQRMLEDSGYRIEKMGDCSARIVFKEIVFYAVCDSPRVSLASGIT